MGENKFFRWGEFVIREIDNSVLVWFRHVAKSLLKKKSEFPLLLLVASFTNHDRAFFLFRQLCLYISGSLNLFTLFLTDSLEKCQTKSFENEYSTFCNIPFFLLLLTDRRYYLSMYQTW